MARAIPPRETRLTAARLAWNDCYIHACSQIQHFDFASVIPTTTTIIYYSACFSRLHYSIVEDGARWMTH